MDELQTAVFSFKRRPVGATCIREMSLFKVVVGLSLALCAAALPGNLQSVNALKKDQVPTSIDMNLILKLKDVVERQEVKIAQLERIIEESNKQFKDVIERQDLKIARLERIIESKSPKTEKQGDQVPRSCHEIRVANPTSESGFYFISPDGTDSIRVECDMTTGTTFISHDSEGMIDAGRCLEPGCYNRTIVYGATVAQMSALAQISRTCRQSFRFDCLVVPFEFNGVQQAWWNDRHGDRQFFWAGSNTAHTCQCGIEGPCVVPDVKCNCDALAAVELNDNGYITNKELLPVTKLNFGRTLSNSSFGRHTLGKFECTGKDAFDKMPESCGDLWLIGHTLNGFYDVKGDDGIRSVFCDFNKLFGDQGMETSVGSVDIKSTPVYFHFQKNATYALRDTVIPFEIEVLNVGGGMNGSAGVFTAPVSGMYQFSFHGVHNVAASEVALFHNSQPIGTAYGGSPAGTHSMPLVVTIPVKSGDTVSLILKVGNVFEDPKQFTHFVGVLLHEELSL